MFRNPDIPVSGLKLTMRHYSEIETLGRIALGFSDCIWALVGCDHSRLEPQSRANAILAWREGLACGAAALRTILQEGSRRGNINATIALHNDIRQAVPELKHQLVMAPADQQTDAQADAITASVNASVEEQRRLLMGDFSDG